MKFKIKKGDTVFVTTGKEKGKTGVVTQVIRDSNRVVLAGINQKVCFKGEMKGQKKDMPLHISNVAHVDPKTKKPCRVLVQREGKICKLISKQSKEVIR